MKKIIYIYVVTTVCAFAQVGINTTNPVQDVHVAGATEGVRVEGLSTTNNVDNLGVGSSTRVYADANGDLVLGISTENIEILFDKENYLADVEDPTSLVNQTGNAFGYTTAGLPADIPNSTFTLTKPAIIEVNYSVSWSVYKTSGASGRIADSHARIVQTGIYFRTGSYLGPAVINDIDGIPINSGPWCIDVNAAGTICQEAGGMLAINGQFYNNANSRNGEYQDYQNTGTDYVKLPPGTYCPLFAAQLAVGDTSGTGAVKMYLGSGQDDIQIIAHYYN